MDIQKSRRILMVSCPGDGVLEVVKDLTGSAPQPNEDGSASGLSHEWNVQTAYYSAKVPIWTDEVTDASAWKDEFLKPEAKEVVDVVGAWVVCSRKTPDGKLNVETEAVMKSIQQILEKHAGQGADVAMLAVALSPVDAPSQSDDSRDYNEGICLDHDFEYIDYAATGLNEFSEKTGLARLKEALEANEWTDVGTEDTDSLNLKGLNLDEADLALGNDLSIDEAEWTAEIFDMKRSLANPDEDPLEENSASPLQQEKQIEDLDKLMSRLLAVKEHSFSLPEAERRRLAARAVEELMQEMQDT